MKTKKKTARERENDAWSLQWDEESSWKDSILLAYSNNIRYDYHIPPAYNIEKAVIKCIKEMKFPKTFKDEVRAIVFSDRYERSEIDRYLRSKEKFGNEWFYGIGTLYRWREGEREKAEARVEKHISTRDKNNLKKLANALEISGPVKSFELGKAMGNE